ncbi:MAG: TetR/AcrR family transcriptional regulator [Pseudomonadota bacterium]
MAGKRRRTAEESRTIVLETAARRLREHGLDGLNITGVAEEAGISHATLLHHFGSSGEMRDALAEKMTRELIEDLVRAMDARVSPAELAGNVFSALAEGGHAKLLAWRAVEGKQEDGDLSEVRALFDQLLHTTQNVLDVDSREDLQRVILVVATAAIGYGIAGVVLTDVLGMSEEVVETFPTWVTESFG